MKKVLTAVLALTVLLLATSVVAQTKTPPYVSTATLAPEDQQLLRRCTELFDNKMYRTTLPATNAAPPKVREYLFTINGLLIAIGGPQKGKMVCSFKGSIRSPGGNWEEKTWSNWFRDEESLNITFNVPEAYWKLFPNADGTLLMKSRYLEGGVLRDLQAILKPLTP